MGLGMGVGVDKRNEERGRGGIQGKKARIKKRRNFWWISRVTHIFVSSAGGEKLGDSDLSFNKITF